MSEHLFRMRINFENVGIDLQIPITQMFCHLRNIRLWKIPSFQDNVLDVKLEPNISQPFDMLNITPVCQHPACRHQQHDNSSTFANSESSQYPQDTEIQHRVLKNFPYEQNNTERVLKRTYHWRYYRITREHSNSIWRIILSLHYPIRTVLLLMGFQLSFVYCFGFALRCCDG